MRPLRILHCVRSPIGGIFRHIEDLARAQAEAGHSVGVICDASTGGDFEDAHIAALRPVLELGVTRISMRRQISPADMLAMRYVLRTVGALAPDVLHGHGAKGGAYARAIGTWLNRRRPVGRFYAPHGGSLHHDPKSLSGRAYFRIERGLERLSDGLVFVSGYEQNVYATNVGAPRVPTVQVRNGLRPAEFDPVMPEPDAADFLFIGMMRDLKGPDVLIDALKDLEERHGRKARALFVGDGPDLEGYVARAAQRGLNGNVRFAPPMPAREAFARARTVVVPSRAESSPYIVLETVAAGMPILVTAVGGIPEMLAPEAERLLRPGDVAGLADALAETLADPEGTAAAAVERRTYFQRRHTLAGMARRVTNFYLTARPDLAPR
jgi:glycosyltransferase involved in cell wall biosynthesis